MSKISNLSAILSEIFLQIC